MGTEIMNVEAFKGKVPDAAFAALNPASESLADGIGSSYAVIGYRGKVWSLRYRGESYVFTRADDGSPLSYLDVIILRSAPAKSKSYYPAGSYEEGNTGARPVCSSIDGVNPDSDVQEKQGMSCAICPRNEWKVQPNGHKGRECSDYKRVAVLVLPNLTKPLLGSPLMEPAFLRVPAASLNDLANFGEQMERQGFHFSTFITRISFVPEKAHPQMAFRAIQPLTAKEAPIVLPMREEPQSKRITGEDQIANNRLAAPVQQKPKEPETVSTGIEEAAAPTATVKTAAKKPELKVVEAVAEPATSILDAPLTAASPQETTTISGDTGEPEEIDDELDARVAGLLNS